MASIRLACGALIASAVALTAQSSGKVDGWTVAMRISSDSDGVPLRLPLVTRSYYTQQWVRVETVEEKLGNLEPRTNLPVMIIDNATNTTSSLNTAQHRVVTMKRPMPDSKFVDESNARFISGPTMTLHDLGAGDVILGHKTHRYSIALRYAARVSVGGEPCTQTVNTIEELWASPEAGRDEQLREYMVDALGGAPPYLGPVRDSLRNLRTRYNEQINGVTLREELTKRHSDATGRIHTTTVKSEMVELAHGPLDRSLFQIPPDFAARTTGTITPDRPYRSAAESVQLAPVVAKTLASLKERTDASAKARLRAVLCDPTPHAP